MDLVTGALGSLVPKLADLLAEEYKLQKGLRDKVRALSLELESAQCLLRKVAGVPPEQLDPQVMLWAREVRDASYHMEDVLDTFLVRGGKAAAPMDPDGGGRLDRLVEKMTRLCGLFRKPRIRREIAKTIEQIKEQVRELTERRRRYMVDDVVVAVAKAAATPSSSSAAVDPRRLAALYRNMEELVGIDAPMEDLIKMLDLDQVPGKKEIKMVSVVGPGGLGKTTLAKAVYDKLQAGFSCGAFVPVGQSADPTKVLRDILIDLDKGRYANHVNIMMLDERQLIDELRGFLDKKRYFIVIDDIWDVTLWKTIKLAFIDNDLGSKIVTTTRKVCVAVEVGCSYKLKPLSNESSKKLFYGRIFGSEDKCPKELSVVSKKILQKCGGVPLAISIISGLLATKLTNITDWYDVCRSIGTGQGMHSDINDMRKILSLSYFDLPYQIKTCFLYIGTFPEDYTIRRDRLIWRWMAEGFVQCEKMRVKSYELGESYFNELIHRSLIQPADLDYDGSVRTFRVHDMVLDLILSLSREEKFVTISDDIEASTDSLSIVRRLSIKNTRWPDEKKMTQVRSLTILIRDGINLMPSLSCFHALRVLDLEGCELFKKSDDRLNMFRCVGELIHLRYLGLRDTLLEVPVEIGKLQFLETLDLNRTWVQLPRSIFGLRRLMCLYGGFDMILMNGQRNLTSLQVLHTLDVNKDSSVDLVEQLGHLTQLRELKMGIKIVMGESHCEALMKTLGNLPKIQHLDVEYLFREVPWAPERYIGDMEAINKALQALDRVTRVHPNHPSFSSVGYPVELIN